MGKKNAPTAYARVRLDFVLRLEVPTPSFAFGPEDHGLIMKAIDLVLMTRHAYAPAGGMPKVVERREGSMESSLDRRPRDHEGKVIDRRLRHAEEQLVAARSRAGARRKG